MESTGSKERPCATRPAHDDVRRRLAVGAGVLAFLVGLALVFVASAPS